MSFSFKKGPETSFKMMTNDDISHIHTHARKKTMFL